MSRRRIALWVAVAVGLVAVCLSSTSPAAAEVFVTRDATSRPFRVQSDRPDAEAAADLLAVLAAKLRALISYGGDRPHVARLRERWDGELHETSREDADIAYSTSKRRIRICLRAPDGSLESANRLFFVLVHEAAHVACPEQGHTPLFWRIFKELLELAEACGEYAFEDTSETSLCGARLGTNPIGCVRSGECASEL